MTSVNASPAEATPLDYYRLLDERRVMINVLRDINHQLQHGTARRAQKILAHASLSIPEISANTASN
jgi:hypothetical protein